MQVNASVQLKNTNSPGPYFLPLSHGLVNKVVVQGHCRNNGIVASHLVSPYLSFVFVSLHFVYIFSS